MCRGHYLVVVLLLVCSTALEVQGLNTVDDLDSLAIQLGDNDPRPPRCKRSTAHCTFNSTDECCLHMYCMKNYICCTLIEPKPSECAEVISRCCPVAPPPQPCTTKPPIICPTPVPLPYCQAYYKCCTNIPNKPYNCAGVIPRCCPKPTPKPCPPAIDCPTCPVPRPPCPTIEPCPPITTCPSVPQPPYCQQNYECCTNTFPKPIGCSQVETYCCPKIRCPAPVTCPPKPGLPYCQDNYLCCATKRVGLGLINPALCAPVKAACCPDPQEPYCKANYECCTRQPPYPPGSNCNQVVQQCCPRRCPVIPSEPECKANYICCTNQAPNTAKCRGIIAKCCPKSCPTPDFCQKNYRCCTSTGVKPKNCDSVTPVCCPKPPIIPCPTCPPGKNCPFCPPQIPCPIAPVPPTNPCSAPCPYQPSPCMSMGGCPPYYPGLYNGFYPGMLLPNRTLPMPPTPAGRRRRYISNDMFFNQAKIHSAEPCDCQAFTNNSLVTVVVTSASQDSYNLLRNQIQIFKNNLKGAITVEILAYGKTTLDGVCEFGEGDCLGNRLLSCASDMSKDDSSIMAFATCIMSSSLLLNDGIETRILAKAKWCASANNYDWANLRDCATTGAGELLMKQAGDRQKGIDSNLQHVPALYFNEEPVWTSGTNDITLLPDLLCKKLIDVPVGRALCQRMSFIYKH